MKRWAWNIVCLFSLLVFAGSVTLWVRSYFVMDLISWQYYQTDSTQEPVASIGVMYKVHWTCGTICFNRIRDEERGGDAGDGGWRYFRRAPVPIQFASPSRHDRVNIHVGGFQYLDWANMDFTTHRVDQALALPFWLFLPAAIPPFLWWRRRRKQGGRGFPVTMEPPSEHQDTAAKFIQITSDPQRKTS